MELIDQAKQQFPRLWSVRLSVLAGILSSAEAGIDAYLTGNAPVVALSAALIAFAAAFARIVAQPELKKSLQEPADE